MKKEKFWNLNLQQFNEPGADGAPSNDGQGAGEGAEPPKSFDEWLAANKDFQAEFDRRNQKSIETAKSKWESAKQTELQEAKTQAEKLAKMSAEERAAEEERQRLAKLDEREQLLNQRELKATAIDILVEKGMPVKLAEVLNYADENTTKAHLDALGEAFSQAVQDEVDKRLVASAEIPGATGSSKGSNPAVEMGKRLANQTNSKPQNDPYFGKK